MVHLEASCNSASMKKKPSKQTTWGFFDPRWQLIPNVGFSDCSYTGGLTRPVPPYGSVLGAKSQVLTQPGLDRGFTVVRHVTSSNQVNAPSAADVERTTAGTLGRLEKNVLVIATADAKTRKWLCIGRSPRRCLTLKYFLRVFVVYFMGNIPATFGTWCRLQVPLFCLCFWE